ncbi:MAG: UspA protein [Deltaproteobacteria bacterium]|nr:UspA protein [Deltaproteobacteria bacterium]
MSFGAILNDFSSIVACLGLAALSSVARFNGNGIKKILVPTDFSEYSDIALQLAIDLAKQQNATINLLHVLRSRDSNEEFQMMQRQISRFPDVEDIEIIPEIRKGKIYEEILNAEAEDNADLIIMSRHRESDSLLSLFRSITAKVRKNARSSVLVVGA